MRLPVIVRISTIVSFVLILVGVIISLPKLLGSRAQTIPTVAATQETIAEIPTLVEGASASPSPSLNSPFRQSWVLHFFQLHLDTGELSAYGFHLERDGRLSDFNLYYDGEFYDDLSQVTFESSEQEEVVSYQDVLEIRIPHLENDLKFEWNLTEASGDPFLESFAGVNSVRTCIARLAGSMPECHVLDEHLSGNISLSHSWDHETVLSLAGEDMSGFLLAFDDYIDGFVMIGEERARVVNLKREEWDVIAELEAGSLTAECELLASYGIYEGLDPLPTNSIVMCDVTVVMDDLTIREPQVPGMLEWIARSGGE